MDNEFCKCNEDCALGICVDCGKKRECYVRASAPTESPRCEHGVIKSDHCYSCESAPGRKPYLQERDTAALIYIAQKCWKDADTFDVCEFIRLVNAEFSPPERLALDEKQINKFLSDVGYFSYAGSTDIRIDREILVKEMMAKFSPAVPTLVPLDANELMKIIITHGVFLNHTHGTYGYLVDEKVLTRKICEVFGSPAGVTEEDIRLMLITFIGEYMAAFSERSGSKLKFGPNMSDVVNVHAKAVLGRIKQ